MKKNPKVLMNELPESKPTIMKESLFCLKSKLSLMKLSWVITLISTLKSKRGKARDLI